MSLSFESLGISETRAQHLESIGFVEPTPIQTQAVPQMLSGRDIIGQAQTGTGKTAAFSLPILEQIDLGADGVQALILTPTRELAMQVKDAVRKMSSERSLYVLTVYGGQSIERQIQQLRRGVQIVVGTPGRVLDLLSRGDLKLDQLRWLVLDEADEMLSMGFIQDVEKILEASSDDRQTAFFSATMDPSIWKLVRRYLKSPITVKVDPPKNTPRRIEQSVYMVPRGWTKARSLQPILELEDPESAIIFVRTKQAASDLTNQLQAFGHSVDEYHGNLNQAQRERLLSRFRRRQVRWVVATDIAARGLDVDHLSHVINYDLPDNVESYVHRIGRTGRAGREGKAITLVQPMDRRKLRMIERHLNERFEIQSVPKRSQIEARHIERLKDKVTEAITGERMASFLPIVAQLGEEYEPHVIAAAALQLAYDQMRPTYPGNEPPADYEDEPMNSFSKPKLVKRRRPKPQPQPSASHKD
ncbi:MAG: DEAD/DEAH box helicase [Microcoleaceae cyanobacterium]